MKSMLRGLGMEMSGNMPAPGRFRSHIDSIWEHFQTYAYSRSGIRYLDQLCCLPQSPFSDWRIDQRYESGDLIQKEAVAIHRKACEQLNACLEAALLDGMLDADSF
ncbi:MAG: hypothetical protein LBU64_13560 [Planctomycetota bacterium]|nr:hypothetical protein [Planctomycetota bacterium]